MELAINYSYPAAQLLKSGRIKLDYFKTPDWEWLIDEAKAIKPIAVHFTLDAGNGQLEQVDWDDIERLMHTTRTPYINLHLDPRQEFHPDLSVDTINAADVERIYQIMSSDLKLVVERFGAELVIVENSPYRAEPGKTLRAAVEPEVITRIVEESGAGLLLDLSHAIITARYFCCNVHEYVESLPVTRIKEMHFAGIHFIDGLWTDHLSILPENWPWLDWALARIASGAWGVPWLLAFEYGGVGEKFEWRCDPAVIESQIPELYERVEKVNTR